MLKVSRKPDGRPEIFYSIQGEGANLGKPAVFLRLGLCNLACTWCDTTYTWDWKAYRREEQLIEMQADDIAQSVMEQGCKHLVVTGGEPLVQQSNLVPVLEQLESNDFFVEVETNGTIVPDQRLARLIDHWSVSPKLESSGNAQSRREIPECYHFFAGITSSHFKYVVQSKADFEELQALVDKYGIPSQKVIMMPEAQTRDALLERSRWLVELCKAHGYMFSTRLHVLLWGNERGK